MTENKPIKDGIDVSQCECYSIKDNSCSDTLSGSCMKEKCQTFRLLQTIKAKTQECEQAKQKLERIREVAKQIFSEMLADEDSFGLDFAEVYNVLLLKDTKRAKEMLDMLGVEY